MNNELQKNETLAWKEEYSVGVKEIDDQHKQLFKIINDLIRVINATPSEKAVSDIVNKLIAYKAVHFGTEEKYFHQFNFEGTAEHEAAHAMFNKRVSVIQTEHKEDVIAFAFALVDFLEDWLIGHLLGLDQKYKTCFSEHDLH